MFVGVGVVEWIHPEGLEVWEQIADELHKYEGQVDAVNDELFFADESVLQVNVVV